jgi:predicted RNA methylase
MQSFFRTLPDVDKSGLMFVESSTYSISHYYHAQWLADNIANNYGNNIILADICSNVGGNTIEFALEGFTEIRSYDTDALACKALENNLAVYSKYVKGKVTVINGDANAQDYSDVNVFFIDPPWGGKEYKKATTVMLYLGDVSLSSFINKHCGNAPVYCKVPTNFDLGSLISETGRDYEVHHMKTKKGRVVYDIIYGS